MAELVFGMATSHAFALRDPADWEAGVAMNRQMFERKYERKAPLHPKLQEESQEENEQRYSRIREAHAFLHRKLVDSEIDALILIGDDQNEHFTEENLPALAMYVGGEFDCHDRGEPDKAPVRYKGATDLAEHLLMESVEHGFDVSTMHSFPNGELRAHAFGPVLMRLNVPQEIPIVPVFVEAIHYPAPTPRRCYEFGQELRRAIGSWEGGERVAFCASGGLSHFTAGYPYENFEGTFGFDYGSIDESFDRQLLEKMTRGEGRDLVNLTSRDLLEHGDIEARSWITGLGMAGDHTNAQVLAYEPFYSGIMGMGVAYWNLAGTTTPRTPAPRP